MYGARPPDDVSSWENGVPAVWAGSAAGATTIGEYRRHVEADPALERRFEKVDVPEPSEAETLEILRGLREKWEAHHAVRVTDEALAAAVPLAVRFDVEHRLPDKAVDLVDKACARARVPMLSMQAPGAAPPADPEALRAELQAP